MQKQRQSQRISRSNSRKTSDGVAAVSLAGKPGFCLKKNKFNMDEYIYNLAYTYTVYFFIAGRKNKSHISAMDASG